MGTWPVFLKKKRWMRPTMPVPVKYSFFARKVIWRLSTRGKKNESITARWFDAMIAAP